MIASKSLNRVYQTIKEEITNVYTRAVDRLKEILDTAKEVFGDIIDRIVELITAIWEWIKDGFKALDDIDEKILSNVMYKMVKVQKAVIDRVHAEHGEF